MAALLCLAAALMAIEIPGYKETQSGEPGPAAFPMLLIGLSVLAAAALVFQTLTGKFDDVPTESRHLLRVGLGAAVLLAAAIGVGYIGSFVTFTCAMTLIGKLAGARRWWTAVLVAAVASWVVLFIFRTALQVPFPTSVVDSWLGIA